MCCRFNYGTLTEAYLAGITGAAKDRSWRNIPKGDVRPADRAPILVGPKPEVEEMRWGFPAFQAGKLLINARSETAYEKKSFADSIRQRRCIVAAEHFYEWDKNKALATFKPVEVGGILLLAGIFSEFEDGKRFTILTTEASESVRPVHDRMPVILPEDAMQDWLLDDKAAREILQMPQPQLIREQEYEQLSLF